MDTTVALFFSLGIVMSPTSEPASTPEVEPTQTTLAQQVIKPSSKAAKRHELVKKRIAATNAWLSSQRQQRRELAQIHQAKPIQISLKTNLTSCNADWAYT